MATGPEPRAGQRLRRVVSSAAVGLALACVVAAVTTAVPAVAAPGDSVPDPGARPTLGGNLVLPGSGGQVGTTPGTIVPAGTTATAIEARIASETTAVSVLGEQLKKAKLEAASAEDQARRATQRKTAADANLARLRARAQTEAAEALKSATALGPFEDYMSAIREISLVAPGLSQQPGSTGLARELLRAEAEAQAATQALGPAQSTAKAAVSRRDSLQTDYDRRVAALRKLEADHAAEAARARANKEAIEASLGDGRLSEVNADGMTANPKALDAVRFALNQQGDPYVFGAEGPDAYDCSGLVLAAYRSVGRKMARIANQQYADGPQVTASRKVRGDLLVPGDLIFFSTSASDWQQIHHVAMYIGSGRMVHAPDVGDVVKISPVYWSTFFGAVRYFPAVPAPKVSPTPPTPTPGSPSPSRTPSAPGPVPSSSSVSPGGATSTKPSPTKPSPGGSTGSPSVPGSDPVAAPHPTPAPTVTPTSQ